MSTMTVGTRGELNMGYETKVILVAIAEIIRKSNSIKEVYEAVAEMANAEGVILKPLEPDKE